MKDIHMRLMTGGLGLLLLLGAPRGGAAQTPAGAAWRDLTLADLDAARDIISRNHPGAARATADTAFSRALADAFRGARERAERVTSYEGWLATLRAFAVGLDDPHIALQTRLQPGTVGWPGFVVARQGDRTVVAVRDSSGTDLPAIGSELVSCDGAPVEAFARDRLGVFRGAWEVASQRVRTTPYLLLDDGNPFLPRPSRCVVNERGAERTVELRWRQAAVTAVAPLIQQAAPIGRAGFGVRRVGDGWWIGMESMSGQAQAVLDSVAAHLDQIHQAPWVVVDVRGNGGGSSEWGRRLAVQLVGQARTTQIESQMERAAAEPRCGGSWRVSADIETTLEGYIRDLGPRLGAASIAQWRRELDAVRAARVAGRELAPEPGPCPASTAGEGPAAVPPSALSGRLLLLTDHACFSSCLYIAAVFPALGATHIGEGTDFSTRYMEVRGFPLPSGLGTFSTLQKVAFGAPARMGPFEPEVVFPGRMDDTAGLERWVQELVRAAR